MIVQFGWNLICAAAGVWMGDWLFGAHTDKPLFLVIMGAMYIAYGLFVLGAKSIYRRLG